MSQALHATVRTLEKEAERHEAVLVSFSGGKDSLVVLDLCSRYFRRVECFFMYLVPGLRCVEGSMKFARERYGVKILEYPHPMISDAIKNGHYCSGYMTATEVPYLTQGDVYDLARRESGIELIATGMKGADNFWRRRNLKQSKENTIHPIKEWMHADVLAYMKARELPAPPAHKGVSTGVCLRIPALLWLHDDFPDDFEKMEQVFPYIGAVVKRREFYGLEA